MKLKVGTKVILKSKQGSIESLNSSAVYKIITERNQKYAVITKIKTNKYISQYIVAEDIFESGDYYDEDDVEMCLSEMRKDKIKKINEIQKK